jgi:S-DNA-T family DNA segregation ATPase FtsK/SpoIIIE
MMKTRVCKACNFLTVRSECLLCGKPTTLFKAPEKKEEVVKVKVVKGESPADRERREVSALIEQRTADFGCPGKVTAVKLGPILTQFMFEPDRFTRIGRLTSLSEDLALSLKADAVTVRRIPGENAMGIYVPNKHPKVVSYSDSLRNVIAHRNDMELPINFGITNTGEPYVEDLANLPHLLIGGSTGSGKSVFINNIVTSLLYIRTPKQMRLILIDPKHVELMRYAGLPHLEERPVSDIFRALAVLEEAIQEMKRRMIYLDSEKVKTLRELNEKRVKAGRAEDQLPHWIIVIDEMAELVLQEKKEFTRRMAEISSMARAAGIHVIAATQRPSVDVLSGKIKVNFPARASFRVPSTGDSHVILNQRGAEQLLKKGDFWYLSPDRGMVRLHAPFVQTADIDKMLSLSIEHGHFNRVPADVIEGDPLIDAVPGPVEKSRVM